MTQFFVFFLNQLVNKHPVKTSFCSLHTFYASFCAFCKLKRRSFKNVGGKHQTAGGRLLLVGVSRWTNLDAGTAAGFLQHYTGFQTKLWAVFGSNNVFGSVMSRVKVSHLCVSLQSAISLLILHPSCLNPVSNSTTFSLSTLHHSCKQSWHFPPPLSALPRRSHSFISPFLDQTYSLTCYIFPSSSSFDSCARPFLPLFKLFLLSVTVCLPLLVRLKTNDWPVHSSV